MSGYGQLVVIEHVEEINSAYAHLSKILVKEGDTIKEGDVIGLSGATGRVTTPHLHYEVRKRESAINPVWFLPAVEE
jgi:murein DD-endopeptidase MepM/ murein hydrolase activator NlpD